MRRLLSAIMLSTVLGLASYAASAQGTGTQSSKPSTSPSARSTTAPAATATKSKEPSAAQKAQQEKMKTCSAEWKASGKKGKAAHTAFMKECLQKT